MTNLNSNNSIISIDVDTRKYKFVDITLYFTTKVVFNSGSFEVNGFSIMRFSIIKICADLKATIVLCKSTIQIKFNFLYLYWEKFYIIILRDKNTVSVGSQNL